MFEGCIDDYPDEWDVPNPPPSDHSDDLNFRGDQYGDNPTYPGSGLTWDIREPYDGFFKVWKVEIIAPDVGYTYDIVYNFDGFGGYPLPEDWECRLDMDGEINGENYADLTLYEVDLDHKVGAILRDLPQTGDPQTWYVIAGIPEPALAQLIGVALGAAWITRRMRASRGASDSRRLGCAEQGREV